VHSQPSPGMTVISEERESNHTFQSSVQSGPSELNESLPIPKTLLTKTPSLKKIRKKQKKSGCFIF
jgi:hypothetical protein